MMSNKFFECNPSRYKGPRDSLVHRCAHPKCLAQGSALEICTRCSVVRYCTKRHQTEDEPRHKVTCELVAEHRIAVDKEQAILDSQGYSFRLSDMSICRRTPYWWGVGFRRKGMRIRFAFAELLLSVSTLDSIQEALEHMLVLLRMDIRDPFKLLHVVPAILLRLNRDQDCLDLIRDCVSPLRTGTDGNALSPPQAKYIAPHYHSRLGILMRTEDANVLDSTHSYWKRSRSASFDLTALLFYMKLCIDITSILNLRYALGKAKSSNGKRLPHVPNELVLIVEGMVVRSLISQSRFVGATEADLLSFMADCSTEVGFLGEQMDGDKTESPKSNQKISNRDKQSAYSIIVDPDEALRTEITDRPRRVSWPEKALAIQTTYAAFWETRSVLEVLRRTHQLIPDLLIQRYGQSGGMTKEQFAHHAMGRYMAERLQDILHEWSNRETNPRIKEWRKTTWEDWKN